ncbi:MAG: THUMP domain-containing protein [Nanoarchaeota archaeon]|nr:THUMP domain-containing protein [Nanoarchaeota archaeon]
METIGLTFKGMEDIAAKEILELTGEKAEIKDSFLKFEVSEEEICKICYLSQSFTKIMAVIEKININTFDENKIANMIKSCSIKKWLKKEDISFAARAIIPKDNNEERTEIEAMIGENIIANTKENLGFTPKVNLNNPDITFIGLLDKNTFYLCIDFTGADISKRDYRIFTHPNALKAGVAYAMLKIADIKEDEIIIDPMCGCGTIAIEAAHFLSKKSTHYFTKDKFAFSKFMEFDFEKEDAKIKGKITGKIHAFDNQMRHIKAAEKNAKIAAVNSIINFSRTDIEWLDTKFKEHSIDKIISFPPQKSKLILDKELEKLFTELFYQAKYTLNAKGKMVLISTEGRINEILEKSAKMHDFKISSKTEIIHGQQKEVIIAFARKSD